MEMKNTWKSLWRPIVLVALIACTATYAQTDIIDEDDVIDLNKIVVKGELYVWNRISDILDLFRLGVGAGGNVGVDIALTKYCNFGAMYTNGHGVDFPHFVPPLWLVHYYQQKPIFHVYDGEYQAVAYGPYREEKPNPQEMNVAFTHTPWDVRFELALLAHVYAEINLAEIFDLVVGVAGFDPSARRKPIDQLSRGVCNIAFGLLEIPINILRTTDEEGDMPGISKGVFLGIWRGCVREVVGVVETVTFPFGWTPIVEPEYVIQKTKTSYWTVRRPAFHKRY